MTKRQEKYLKMIIESYINDGIPLASSKLIHLKRLEVSSATVRNEMHKLEEEGMLEKSHSSSGRIPSTKGYEFYAKHLANKEDKNLQNKLMDIFAKRRVSIDFTIEEAANTISKLANLTLVTTSSETDELLKSIQLTPLSAKAATIVLVTSTGRVESKILKVYKTLAIEDLRIAIRLFKERLIDTPLKKLSLRVDALAPILSKLVKNYEVLIQAFIGKVFDFHDKITNKVYGNANIIQSDISREALTNLIELIENKSVWSSIEGKLDEDDNMKIEVRDNNVSIVSTKLKHHGISKEISAVGSNRMNYAEAKQAIKLLETFFRKDNENE